MGILNLTPDSFSDGGQFLAPEDALAHARRMVEQGAQVIIMEEKAPARGGSSKVSRKNFRESFQSLNA